MQCSGAHILFGCLCNAWVFMHCLVVFAMIWLFLKFSGIDAMTGCQSNVWVSMQCLGVDSMFRC